MGDELEGRTYTCRFQARKKIFWVRTTIPPSSVADPPSIHLPHVSHSYDANCGVFHVGSIFVGSRVDPVEHGYYFFQCISTLERMKKVICEYSVRIEVPDLGIWMDDELS